MSDYMDNNKNSEWKVTDDKAILRVDHGNHYHDLDLTKATLEDLYNNTGKTFGDAHRASDHYKK